MKSYWAIKWVFAFFLVNAQAQIPQEPGPDLGDAPDSYNHFGAPMSAYPGVQAEFPTVFDRGGMPPGPIHYNREFLFFLGESITIEDEADIGYDFDGVNNLMPKNDVPDLDNADDGYTHNGNLTPLCKPYTVKFDITATQPLGGAKVYVNIWMDFNRNGRWSDKNQCNNGSADEWVVQNQVITLTNAGTFSYTSNPFLSYLGTDEDYWVRITVAESPAGPASYDGSGPKHGYEYGETEDYLYKPCYDFGLSYPAGVNDNFGTSNNEPTSPSAGLLAAYPVNHKPFDNTQYDRHVLHSWENLSKPGYTICSARLEIRLKPTVSALSRNDSVQLSIRDNSGALLAPSWGRYIGTYNGVQGLLPNTWNTSNYGATTIWLDLNALPVTPSGTVSMLGDLNTHGKLDFLLQDDTTVDYMVLHVSYCCNN